MIKYLDLISGIMCVLYYFYLEIVYKGMAFDTFFMIIGSILIIYHFMKNKIHINKKLKKFISIFITIGIFIFILLESILIFFPKQNVEKDCDYLLILGAAVKNTTPSLTLKGRLDTAIDYMKKSKDDCYIVVSGGQGKDENISEAKAMKIYLENNGVSKDRIILEDKATSTYENFKYSKDKIESHSNKNIKNLDIKVVTTDFHSFRSFLLAKENGYNDVSFYSSNSLKQFIPVYYTREFFAIIKTVIFDICLNL